MAVPKQMIGIKGDECQCGRRASVRHCIACGSSRLYARQNRFHQFPSGEVRFVQTEFRCQTCNHLFVEEERPFCNAPPVGDVLAGQKVRALIEAKKQGEYLRPNDEKAADALQGLLPKTEVTDNDLKNTWFALRRAWLDAKLQQGLEQPLLDFLGDNLKGANCSQEHIDKILQWQREETQRATSA